MALRTRSDLYRRALELIPGGVNSPVRAMRAVGLERPLFAARGEGAYLEDADGRRYVDWVLSWGPLIFGHADPETVETLTTQIVNKLLHTPTVRAKEAGSEPLRDLFALRDRQE